MTSDFSHPVRSSKVALDRVRRSCETAHHQRHHLHSKRAATVDSETNEEKLRIVVLGATKVGQSNPGVSCTSDSPPFSLSRENLFVSTVPPGEVSSRPQGDRR